MDNKQIALAGGGQHMMLVEIINAALHPMPKLVVMSTPNQRMPTPGKRRKHRAKRAK